VTALRKDAAHAAGADDVQVEIFETHVFDFTPATPCESSAREGHVSVLAKSRSRRIRQLPGLEQKILATQVVGRRVFISAVVNIAQALNLDLVTRAQAGDDGAFTALLRPAIAPAYRLAGAMLHDPHAAEDVVQDASLKAWRKLGQLKAGAQMQPWFLGIVANECRSARRTRWWSVLWLSDPEQPVAAAGDSMAASADLRRAIRRLRHRRRLLLVLHWYLDLPVAEVAAITGSSEDAVKSELSRAVRELRRLLGAGDA